jgi:transposase
MSTKMDEDDWAHTLAVFRACLPRRGRRAEGDRRFLEALHFFTVENVRWRALPEPLRSLEQRVETLRSLEQGWRLRGVLRHARIHEFNGASHSDVRLDHCARACVGGRSKRGEEGQALGRSRGGFITKIHGKSDASGGIIAFDLTGGEAFDGRQFETLLGIGPDIQPRAVICDKGYASKANREAARARGIAPVIPHKANEKNKPAFFARFARALYKARARIEQGVGRLKRFKRVALRCQKTARNFRSIVSFAAGLCLIKFAHAA